MKESLIFYVGFTMGLCFMDYLDVLDNADLHLYRKSIFRMPLTMLTAPFTFPFYLVMFISSKIKEMYL